MYLLIQILDLYMFIIIIRVLLSWIKVNQFNPVVKMIYNVTEPVLAPVRAIIPDLGGIDISPVVVFLVYRYLIRGLLIGF